MSINNKTFAKELDHHSREKNANPGYFALRDMDGNQIAVFTNKSPRQGSPEGGNGDDGMLGRLYVGVDVRVRCWL
jgi:hypothetical protein